MPKLGQTLFRVNDDPEIGQLSADLTNNEVRSTQLWVTFRVKLTGSRSSFTGMEFDSSGTFPGQV